MEVTAKRFLKIGAIVGASLFVGYKTYHALSKNDPKPKKESKKQPVSEGDLSSGILRGAKQRIAAVLFTLLYDAISERFRKGKKEVEDSLADETN